MKKFFESYSREQLIRVVGGAFVVLAFFGYQSSVDATTLGNSIDALIVNGSLVVGFVSNLVGWIIRKAKGDTTGLLGRRVD